MIGHENWRLNNRNIILLSKIYIFKIYGVNIVLEIATFRFYNCILKNEDGIEIEQVIISYRRLKKGIGEELYLKYLTMSTNLT